ncbi:MAG TPA: sulfite exporter TauE/SafE family protein [Aggregatilinea sp.]|jgi:uncharacterized membrane protein YfcA|uniref:sulfite exporter TauE/SafE family protein n=1 Tax=Aggregatilinea sp. TaxID=2806333 RepID=UPI002CE111D7|nr:sulfite exporter TauE/SafE family protein [Aggregatilinea sp.]HML20868.1 sulfite exporter TauE/SafE family protein [Aggregatilinea sp.]
MLILGLGFTIGFLLSLLGGGGSIVTVPVLVYIIGQTPQTAVATSLAVVGANSTLGAFFHRSQLNWRVALVFGGAGIVVSYLAAGLSERVSPAMLMVLFALLMLGVAALMAFRPWAENTEQVTRQWWVIVLSGAGVGLLTGFLGVGGGFLIVPALVILVGLPMPQAVATSLVIIAVNSLSGFLGHLTREALDVQLILLFTLSGFAGAFSGAQVGKRLPASQLRQAFVVFILMLAVVLLYDNLPQVL